MRWICLHCRLNNTISVPRIDSDWGTLEIQSTEFYFVPNRFASTEYTAQGQTVLFQTGDRGCQNVDGTMLLEGRIVEI